MREVLALLHVRDEEITQLQERLTLEGQAVRAEAARVQQLETDLEEARKSNFSEQRERLNSVQVIAGLEERVAELNRISEESANRVRALEEERLRLQQEVDSLQLGPTQAPSTGALSHQLRMSLCDDDEDAAEDDAEDDDNPAAGILQAMECLSAGRRSVQLLSCLAEGPPAPLRGVLEKRSPSRMRLLNPFQERFVVLQDGKLSWWSDEREWKEAKVKCKGSLDFANNDCRLVQDPAQPRRLSIAPRTGEWEATHFSKAQFGRVLEFQVAVAASPSLEDWLNALTAHLHYGSLRRDMVHDVMEATASVHQDTIKRWSASAAV